MGPLLLFPGINDKPISRKAGLSIERFRALRQIGPNAFKCWEKPGFKRLSGSN
jgi:hypothetical protein